MKKRNVGKVGLAGIAAVAGLALAATLFAVTQPGSANYTPKPPGGDGYVKHTLTQDDIKMSEFAIGEIGVNDATSFESKDQAEAALDAAPTTFTFENFNRDYDADVRVTGVTLKSSGEAHPELLDALYVHIYREAGSRNLIYSGKLADWGQGAYVSNIPAGLSQEFMVWAWINPADAEDLAGLTQDEIELGFQVEYVVTDLAESNLTAENGGDTLTARPNQDDLQTLAPARD